jgi:hypothetical protein
MSASKIYGPIFFAEQTVTGITHLDTLAHAPTSWRLGQTLIFQQDGASPYYHRSVTYFLNETVSDGWIVRGRPTAWPPRSPDLTPMDFFLWRCVKDLVYVPPLPRDIKDLMIRIRESIQSVDRDTVNKTWNELLWRVDVIRVTNGAHTEHLKNGKRILWLPLFSDSNIICRSISVKLKVKQSLYTPWRRLGGEEV